MIDETLESAAGDLAEVRDKLDAAREALERALEASGGDADAVRRAIARLERIEEEITTIEGICAGRAAAPQG